MANTHELPKYLPSEEEIAREAAIIRAGWSEYEKRQRAPHLYGKPLETQVISNADLGLNPVHD